MLLSSPLCVANSVVKKLFFNDAFVGV